MHNKAKTTIGIIGYGVVGKATASLFEKEKKEVSVIKYDKFISMYDVEDMSSLHDVLHLSDYIFLCLPTPFYENAQKIDLEAFDEILCEIDSNNKHLNYKQIVIIKSTVVPGTTETWEKKYPNIQFVFSPEFLTETNALYDTKNPDRFIVGSNSTINTERVLLLHEGVFDNNPEIFVCTPTEAELAKYASNCFLATKVIFANEMEALASHFGVSWNESIVKLVTSDTRIGNTHFQVTPERGFSKKCFPKDMIALLGLMKELNIDAKLLTAVWQKNLEIRKNHDWLNIPFVQTSSDSSDTPKDK